MLYSLSIQYNMLYYVDSLFHHEDTAEMAILRTLSNLWNQHTYSIVYVAFGAKYNESRVVFRRTDDQTYRANYEYQMAPTFLRNKVYAQGGALSIVLDDFSNESSRQSNVNISHQILQSISSPYHLDIVLYHRPIQLLEFGSLTTAIATFLSRRNVSPEQTIFANYIVYKHPNAIESNQQKQITKKIHESLTPTEYKDRFYQWFGYASFYTYYLLYRYSPSVSTQPPLSLIRSFESIFEDMPVTTGTIPRIFMSYEIADPAYRCMIQSFLTQLMDMCTYDHTNPSFRTWLDDFTAKAHSEKTNLLD